MPTSAKQGTAPFVPDDRTLPVLQEAVQHCRSCDLYREKRSRYKYCVGYLPHTPAFFVCIYDKPYKSPMCCAIAHYVFPW